MDAREAEGNWIVRVLRVGTASDGEEARKRAMKVLVRWVCKQAEASRTLGSKGEG